VLPRLRPEPIAHPKLFHYWFLYATPYNINLFNFRFSERINLQRIRFNLFNLQLTIVNSGKLQTISDSQRYINIYIFVYITCKPHYGRVFSSRSPVVTAIVFLYSCYYSHTPIPPNILNGEFTMAVAQLSTELAWTAMVF